VVDDEEAILETMAFTFEDDYDVTTSPDPERALSLMGSDGPFAVVITDQRMPGMTGVEFLAQVWERHPETTRIMLTGFADMDATIQAINDGHVFAYVNKPWEPDQLKQVVKSAVDHNRLVAENRRLVDDLQRTKVLLEAVMDRLHTGAIAVDESGLVRAANRPAREYLDLEQDPRGRTIGEVLGAEGLEEVGETVRAMLAEGDSGFEELDVVMGGVTRRLRLSVQRLQDDKGQSLGSVTLFREVSHEPLRRRFDEIVVDIAHCENDLRSRLERALEEMAELERQVGQSKVESGQMSELQERATRAQTAIQNWLDVDDVLAAEEYPDAQLLRDRLRIARRRWPKDVPLPSGVQKLAKHVEAYYESGENPRTRVL